MKKPKLAVLPYRHHLKYKFVLDLRAFGHGRKFFKTRAEADAERKRQLTALERHGREAIGLSQHELSDFIRARKTLAEYGKTINDAADFLVAHLKAVERSCTIAALVNEFIAKKKKKTRSGRPASGDYLVDLNVRLGRFKKDFGERMAATIKPEEVEDWLSGLKDARTGENLSRISRSNYARTVGVMFAHAVRRKYTPENPFKEISKPTGGTKPGVLDVEQTARLLEVASPEILPYFAIGLFAGLRSSELERLSWQNIDFEENEIAVIGDGESHKSERHVDMLPNLREWLLPLRKHSGKITPENFRKHFDSARNAAGIVPWPDNAVRHSFGSYHLKHFGNDALTRLQMGHWRDSTVLFGHYRRAVTRRNAERYWKIVPAVKAENLVAFSSNAIA
jgi:integrase